MKVQSAAIYACAGYVGGLLAELWRLHQGGRPTDLGLAGTVIGLLLFAVLFAAIIYCYASCAWFFRWTFTHKGELVAAYSASAAIGLPFWFILTPLHEFLRDRLGYPDSFWWLEGVLLCAVSFEIIRLSSKLLTKGLTSRSSGHLQRR